MVNKIKNLLNSISLFKTDGSSVSDSNTALVTTFTLFYKELAVGELSFKDKIWSFKYTKMFQNQSEIEPVPSFPDLTKEYKSEVLWPFFQTRIPSLKQPKIKDYIKEKGINENDIITLLKTFGTKSINNPFVLQS